MIIISMISSDAYQQTGCLAIIYVCVHACKININTIFMLLTNSECLILLVQKTRNANRDSNLDDPKVTLGKSMKNALCYQPVKGWKGLSVSRWFAELFQSDHFHVTVIFKVREEAQVRNIHPSSLCDCFLSKSK